MLDRNYIEKMKTIRPYVNFDFDLRKPLKPHEKAKITRYFNAITKVIRYDTTTYNPRNKENIKKAVEHLPYDLPIKGLKAVPIIKRTEERPRIRITKSGISLDDRHVTRRFYRIDPMEFARDPFIHVMNVLEGVKANRYTFVIGVNDFGEMFTSKEKLADSASFIFGKYELAAITGIAAFTFKNQIDFKEYNKRRSQKQSKGRAKRKKKNSRNRR